MKKYLIAIFLLALITPSVAFASWWNPFSWKVFNKAPEIRVEKSITPPLSNTTDTPTKETTPTKRTSPAPTPTIKTTSKVKEENVELKIELCKATKEATYNDAVQKLNQAINNRLEEAFNSLSRQYKSEIKKINDETNAKISSLTGDYISFYSQSYNNDAAEQMRRLYENQQAFWYSQKREIENSKQKAIDQINLLSSDEYTNCLNGN